MKYSSLIFVFASLLACDGGSEPAAEPGDRGPIGKADLMGSCEGHCGDMSDGNCWCDAECVMYGDCCEDVAEVCEACVDGFELVEDESACLADAGCYALDGGGFCTGMCPAGQELDLSSEPVCVPDDMPCAVGFELVPTEGDCHQDVACYEIAVGWCTGMCPAGSELQMDETGAHCVPATPTCLPGFDLVETESDCHQDALCYASGDMFCTGNCPEGTTFMQTETGPACI